MADFQLQRCPRGHFYDAGRFAQCPYCPNESVQFVPPVQPPVSGGASVTQPVLEPAQNNASVTQPIYDPAVTQPIYDPAVTGQTPPAETVKKPPKLPLILVSAAAAIAAVLAIVFYGQMTNYHDMYLRASSSELENLRAKEALEERVAELEGRLAGYSDLDGLYGYGSDTYYAARGVVVAPLSGGSVRLDIYFGKSGTIRYNNPNTSGINCEWSKEWSNSHTDLIATPKAAGFYPVHFSNDEDAAAFDVLFIVTE